MEDLRPAPQRLGESREPGRHDHEFLKIHRVVGMRAAIEDVHHRRRQDARIGAAHITIERQTGGFRRGLGGGQRHAQKRVGAQALLILGAVQANQKLVDQALLARINTGDGFKDLGLDRRDGLQHALALVAVAAIALFNSFVRAGRGAGRHRGAAHGAVFQEDVHFHSRVAPAVENFTGGDIDNGGHGADVLQVRSSRRIPAPACELFMRAS